MNGEPWIWQALAIPSTSDATAIRRAYATRLKITHPEDDPEAFKTLRAAYELALRLARGAAPKDDNNGSHGPVATVERPAPQPKIQVQPDPMLEQWRNSFQELAAALAAGEPVAEERAQQALATLLQSPALQNVDLERQAEQRLAHLLASTIPRSDPLLMHTARRFGWLDQRVGKHVVVGVDAILARLNDLAFLQSLQSAQSPYSRAFKELQGRKLPVWSWVKAHIPKKGQASEYQLLHLIRVEHPGLLSALNPKTIEWWDRMARRPQPSGNLMLVGIVLGAVLGGIGYMNDASAAGTNTVLVFAGLVLWKLFLLDWPRFLIRRKWPVEVPAWIRGAWLPLAIVCLGGSLAASGWALYSIAFLALATIQWSLIARGITVIPGAPNSEREFVMAVFVPQAALMTWWVCCIGQFPAGSVERIFTPFFSLMLASALGAPALRTLWTDALSDSQRSIAVAALIALSSSVCALLWTLSPSIEWRPACAALVLIVVALHRPITLHLSDSQQKARVAFIVALIAVLVVATVLLESVMQARGVMLAGGGIILIAASTFSMALALRNERRASSGA